MDDMSAFERKVADELRALMGPVLPVDDAEVFRAIAAARAPSRRMHTMFSATKVVMAGVVVALFGAFLLAGTLSEPRDQDLAPAASTASSEPPKLVYALDGDVWVANEDGTDAVRILDGDPDAPCGGYSSGGDVSPDGRYLAVRSEWSDDCPGTVTILGLDGRLLVTVPGMGWDVAWSPDSSRFATWISLWETIGVYGIDGALQAELATPFVSHGDHDPRWTPDGTALLHPGAQSVWRLSLDGAKPEIVAADDPLSNRSVSFAPDGTHLAFEGPNGQLVVAGLDGAPVTLGSSYRPGDWRPSWEHRPLWSPAGDRVAIVTSRSWTTSVGEDIVEATSIWVVDLTTGGSTMVATQESQIALLPIAFSPDGERILVQAFDDGGERAIWVVASDGLGTTSTIPGARVGGWVQPSSTQD